MGKTFPKIRNHEIFLLLSKFSLFSVFPARGPWVLRPGHGGPSALSLVGYVAKLTIAQTRRLRHVAENNGSFYYGARSIYSDGHSGRDAKTEPR